MTASLSILSIFAGFGLISLGMRRHRSAWAGQWAQSNQQIVVAGAFIFGSAFVAVSIAIALLDNIQLGAIYWAAYAMAAGLAVTAFHSYGPRKLIWAIAATVFSFAAVVLLFRALG